MVFSGLNLYPVCVVARKKISSGQGTNVEFRCHETIRFKTLLLELTLFFRKKKKKPGVSSNEMITVYRGGDVIEITVNPIGYCIIYNVGCFYFIDFGR